MKIRLALAAAALAVPTALVATPAQAAGFCVTHHSPDAGAAGAFALQKADGSIVYAGQGQTKCGIVRWYIYEGEDAACWNGSQFVKVFTVTGWHPVNQNWNSCVTQLNGTN